jgi:predicted NBD/HSP70 family sugar kinase/biotin operon repressor
MDSDQTPPLVLDALEHNIVQAIRLHRQQARNELAATLGSSRSSVTQSVKSLIQRGILKDVEAGNSTGGRRPRLLDLNEAFGYVIGIHMGVTGTNICIADFRGQIVTWQRLAVIISDEPASHLDIIFARIFELLAERQIPHNRVHGLGIGVPAPIEKETDQIVSPASMPGWQNYPLADYCHQHFPHAVIKIDNDVSLMALGELRAGMGRHHNNFFFVKIGTGIGCGIVCNGAIYRGETGCAGHIGHVSVDPNGPVCRCGNVGCLERFASGAAIAEQALAMVATGRSTVLAELMNNRGGALLAEDVGVAARQGDRVANEIIIESGRVIGEVLAALVSFFNPGLVIVGGGVSNIGPQLLVSIHRTILEYSLPLSTQDCVIRKSEMGYFAGMEGAVALALDHSFVRNG